MFHATLYYGRKGIVVNTISGVDLALWDLLAKVRHTNAFLMLDPQSCPRSGLARRDGLKSKAYDRRAPLQPSLPLGVSPTASLQERFSIRQSFRQDSPP